MPGVPQWIADGPYIGIAAFLTMIVFLRSQATYWACLVRHLRFPSDVKE